MHYDQYLEQTREAANVITRGKFVSLAGGYYGVQFPTDGAFVLVALDLDEDSGWYAWTEDHLGDRCCQLGNEIGWPDDLERSALMAVIHHRCDPSI